MRALLLCLPLAVIGCTPTAAQRDRMAAAAETTQASLDRALAGFAPEAGGACYHSSFYRGGQSTQAYGKTLLYRVSPKLIFRTETSGGCERVGDDAYMVISTPSGDQCRGDIAQAVDRGSRQPMGSCSLGDFVAYRKR